MVHTRSIREIDKITRSCQIVADTLIFLEIFQIKMSLRHMQNTLRMRDRLMEVMIGLSGTQRDLCGT